MKIMYIHEKFENITNYFEYNNCPKFLRYNVEIIAIKIFFKFRNFNHSLKIHRFFLTE